MDAFVQGLIVSFREGLEAFLIIGILLKFLDKTGNKKLKKSVWKGMYAGIFASLLIGAALICISSLIGSSESMAKMWESISSLIAVALVTTFIIWMIKHGSKIKEHVEKEASMSLTKTGIFLLAMIMVVREGAEIALFSFAGKYAIFSIVAGILASVIAVFLVMKSIVNVKISTIFNVTMAYLILQAGFLLGYSLHEGMSASKELGYLTAESPHLKKAYDLSAGVLDHKEGTIGMPLYVAVGWYSKPEWVQFIAQYAYTFSLFGLWHAYDKSIRSRVKKAKSTANEL